MHAAMLNQQQRGGAGLRLLTETVVPPRSANKSKTCSSACPTPGGTSTNSASRHAYRGAQLAFGKPIQLRYDFTKADVVLSLDCDFLTSGRPVCATRPTS